MLFVVILVAASSYIVLVLVFYIPYHILNGTPSTVSSTHISLTEQIVKGYDSFDYKYRDNEYSVRLVNNEYWITIRGTETKHKVSLVRDVITDIRAYPWYDKEVGWHHAGFLKAARGIANQLENNSLLSLHEFRPIRIAGHSLGGGIARVLAQFLMARGYDVLEVMVLGCPRASLNSTKYWCKNTSYRVGNDYVTTVPWGKLFPYKHPYEVGQGKLVQLGSIYDPDKCDNWKDHNIDLYLKYMKEIYDAR